MRFTPIISLAHFSFLLGSILNLKNRHFLGVGSPSLNGLGSWLNTYLLVKTNLRKRI